MDAPRMLARSLPAVLMALSACRGPRDADSARRYYDHELSSRAAPLLREAIHFPTVPGNAAARAEQQAWLLKTATDLGFTVRDAGKFVEIDLPGPERAPVLGLVVHGDVVPVDKARWTIPPFEGAEKDGAVVGRGSADDKGPMIQALLAMKALAEAGPARTHTIRLLVGSDEESDNTDVKEYLAGHAPPDYSLVLDSRFPVVIGEMAWNALYVDAVPGARSNAELPFRVAGLRAGLSPGIVPDRAELTLQWLRGMPSWDAVTERFQARTLPEGTRLEFVLDPESKRMTVVAHGKSAHGGVNLEAGRNALVALARAAEGVLPVSGEADLLAFARVAGEDLHGSGLGLTEEDPVWGRYLVNVATIQPAAGGKLRMEVVLRRPPPRTAAQLRQLLAGKLAEFNKHAKAALTMDGYWDDEPLTFDPESKLVRRLLAAYEHATGESATPAISGGATYAKRLPNSIAFGMWFPGKPYPGHDVDERIPVEDLHRGVRVLIVALADLACGPKLDRPLER